MYQIYLSDKYNQKNEEIYNELGFVFDELETAMSFVNTISMISDYVIEIIPPKDEEDNG